MKIGLNARGAKVGKKSAQSYQFILGCMGHFASVYIITYYTRGNSPFGDNYLPNFAASKQNYHKLY
jgi:hypothetical protein